MSAEILFLFLSRILQNFRTNSVKFDESALLHILSDTLQSIENAVDLSTRCDKVCRRATRSSEFDTIEEGV